MGYRAGFNEQHDRTIVLNANDSAPLNTNETDRFFVKPIRNLAGNLAGFSQLYYNPTTGEIAYNDA